MLELFEEDIIADRLEGWELVEFLQIPIEAVLAAAHDFEWINEENIDDLREFVGLKND